MLLPFKASCSAFTSWSTHQAYMIAEIMVTRREAYEAIQEAGLTKEETVDLLDFWSTWRRSELRMSWTSGISRGNLLYIC